MVGPQILQSSKRPRRFADKQSESKQYQAERRANYVYRNAEESFGQPVSGGLPEFDNLFNHFFRAEEVAMWRAPASIWEADNMFHIEVDAPGVMKEDVELTFDKGTLQITLERKAPGRRAHQLAQRARLRQGFAERLASGNGRP